MKRFCGEARGDLVFVLALLMTTIAYLALDYTYKPALRAVPAIVAWIMVALLLLDLASHLKSPLGSFLRMRLNPATERAAASVGRQIEAILWVLGFAAMLILLGVLYAVPLFVFAFMRFRGERPMAISALGGAGMLAFVWLLFSLVLRIELYSGLLFGSG